jgi:cytochrome P450
VTAAAVQACEHSPIDITSHDFWSQPFAVRDETFAQLRRGEGHTWQRPFASMFPVEEPGYWALTRRADIAYVSRHPELFTSAQGSRFRKARSVSSTTSSARATSTSSRHALRGFR